MICALESSVAKILCNPQNKTKNDRECVRKRRRKYTYFFKKIDKVKDLVKTSTEGKRIPKGLRHEFCQMTSDCANFKILKQKLKLRKNLRMHGYQG